MRIAATPGGELADPFRQQAMFDQLSAQGWSQQDDFLPDELTVALAAECRLLHDSGALALAAVGRAGMKTLRADIRGDQIGWLGAGQSLACDRYLALMEQLRVLLNGALYLGLDDYESHFAFYAPGAHYLQHLDRFRGDDRRTVSVVIYLNADWLHGQGGALRLHPQGHDSADIAPHASKMVLFLSAEMLHEVLPATRDRLSLAGWFRRRA